MSSSAQAKLAQLVEATDSYPRTCNFAFIIFLCVLVTYMRKKWIQLQRRRKQMPPGPIGIPIFGDLLRFWQLHNTKRHFDYLRDLAAKYPKIASINTGADDVIIINDLNLLKQMMSRPELLDRDPAFMDFVGEAGKSHAVQNGKEWLAHKKVTQDIVNTYGIQNVDAMLERCLESVILPRIEANLGRPMQMFKFLRYGFFWTVFRLIYGKNESFKDLDQKTYDDNLETHINLRVIPVAFISHVLGSWYFPLRDMNREFVFYYFNKYQNVLTKYWQDYVSCNKQKDCMLDLFQNQGISQAQILSEISNVMGGSIDNATNVTMFALYNLGRMPALQNELFEEVARVMGANNGSNCVNVQFDYKKVSQCQKLKAFIHENMRLLVPNSIGATRYCNKDTFVQVDGKKWKIPKNTVVWWNVVSTTFSNENWDLKRSEKDLKNGKDATGVIYDASELHIERWLDKNGKFVNRNELLTFGWGKRKCTGRLIVIKEFMHLYGILLSKYKISLGTERYSKHMDDVKVGIGFTECHDFPVVFERRY